MQSSGNSIKIDTYTKQKPVSGIDRLPIDGISDPIHITNSPAADFTDEDVSSILHECYQRESDNKNDNGRFRGRFDFRDRFLILLSVWSVLHGTRQSAYPRRGSRR